MQRFAIDAIHDYKNPWIKISTIETTGFIEIRVQDCGPGINQKVLDKLFNPFFTTKPAGRGTGLGLSISRTIAEDHGGSLAYRLIDGHTTFILTLPKEEARNAA